MRKHIALFLTIVLLIFGLDVSVSSAGVDVVFQDNMESGPGGWFAQAPWGQTTATSHSATHAWTDSPGGNYSNNTNSLLFSPILNFRGLSSVTLSFWQRYDLEDGFDFGSVYITTDNGFTFTNVASFTGTNNTWTPATINLTAFAGQPSVRIVFQLFSDSLFTRDGWYIDDMVVTEPGATEPGDVFVSTYTEGNVYKIDPGTGDKAIIASGLDLPEDMVIDSGGILYIGGVFTGVKRFDTKTNTFLSDVGTNVCGPEGPSIDPNGDLYVNTRREPCSHSGIWKLTGRTAVTAVQVVPPFTTWGEGMAVLKSGPFAGDLIAADAEGPAANRIVRSSPPGFGGPVDFITALTDNAVGIAVSPLDGDVFFAQPHVGIILRYQSNGAFKSVFATGLNEPHFLEFDAGGHLYVAENGSGSLLKVTPGGTKTVLASGMPEIVGVAVFGQAPQPVPSVTPSSLDFGSVPLGSTKDLTFSVQNTGGGTLTGSASTSAPFSIVGDNSFNLSATESKNITVRFSPTSTATFNGNVNFTSNGGNASPPVTGIGVTAPTQFTLTVNKSGTGSGTITSSPTGINCGTDCEQVYARDKIVKLTAKASKGSTFAGWSGACTGNATCSVTMDGTKAVTATFNLILPPAPVTKSITPSSGPAGIVVTIKGKNFGANQSSGFVAFGLEGATIQSWTNTQIKAVVPLGVSDSVSVTVSNSGGTSPGKAFIAVPFTDGFDFPLVALNGGFTLTEADDGDGWYVVQNGNFRDFNSTAKKFHLGEDWNREGEGCAFCDEGEPVYASANGIVMFAGDGGCGKNFCWNGVVIIKHYASTSFSLPNGSNQTTPITTLYGHLNLTNLQVALGNIIWKNTRIGFIGPKPRGASGPHLHFEVRPDADSRPGAAYRPTLTGRIDPTDFINLNR